MTTRQSLEDELKRVMAERDTALEPVRKRRREEENEVSAPFEADIKALQDKIKAEKEKSIWIVVAKAKHFSKREVRSGYLTHSEAMANCPPNSRSYEYHLEKIVLNRTSYENKLEDDPVSK